MNGDLKLRHSIDKPKMEPVEISKAKLRLENYERYLCIVISVDDETPIPYYDEGLIYAKYHEEGEVFVDSNDNDWGIEEILFVYLPEKKYCLHCGKQSCHYTEAQCLDN
jgi:hypothetical protein